MKVQQTSVGSTSTRLSPTACLRLETMRMRSESIGMHNRHFVKPGRRWTRPKLHSCPQAIPLTDTCWMPIPMNQCTIRSPICSKDTRMSDSSERTPWRIPSTRTTLHPNRCRAWSLPSKLSPPAELVTRRFLGLTSKVKNLKPITSGDQVHRLTIPAHQVLN